MSVDTARRKPAPTRQTLLARLHCIKHERVWSDDEYRDILHGLSGKRSAADLDLAGLTRVVAVLGHSSVRVPAVPPAAEEPEWAFLRRAAKEKQPLLRKIAATCTALGTGRAYAEGILRRQSGGLDRHLQMASYDELYKIAQALVNTQRHRASKQAAVASEVSA